MTIDPDLVTRKLLLISRDLEALRTIQTGGVDTYLTSALHQAAAERHLERLIGRMIDVNYHLLTESGQPPPADYYASFLQLATIGVLSPDFALALAPSAGLRNRIVHEYDELDHRKIFEALRAALEDVPAFVKHVDAYVRRLTPP